MELLEEGTDYGCSQYAYTLFRITGRADEVGPILERMLASADPRVRASGCSGLGNLGREALPWKPAIQQRVEDGDLEVSKAASLALARIPER